MIEVNSVSFRYHEEWVLQEVSFLVEKGEFVGVIGPNGSGKTTLLKILYRLLAPQRGEILFELVPMRKMDRKDIAKRIAVVAQETQLLFPFSVLETVLMGRSPYLGRLLFEGEKDLEVVRKAMEWTKILPFSERPVDELSGGERKRVFIARALAQEPDVILLDEPTANLDIQHQIDFLDLILTLNRERGLTIVMASHDMNIASEFCDRLILLQGGRIYQIGTSEEVVTKENIESVYGCEVWIDQHPVSGMPRISLLKKRGD
ncbi:MAG TPA: ABC transporter ATP-binding protein [Thermodesulfobacteriota bacterium]|nr:ABC transporter ATP-binding protein [Thermodesulfobacteriota bacterium]